MKNIFKIFVLLTFITININAHKPNVAYFNTKIVDQSVEVIAELPWTFRPALLKEFPKLESNSTTNDFENAIFNYFNKNIVVKANDEVIILSEVIEVKQGHSHSAVYKLIYKSQSDINKLNITNTCLFQINNDQQNINSFIYSDKNNKQFTTSKLNENYQIDRI